MKKFLALLLCGLLCTFMLAACGKETASSEDQQVQEEEKTPITIKFLDGKEELGVITINAGEKVTGYEQYEVKEGYTFLGWFKTPSFMEYSKQDLTEATFKEDTRLFASFKSDTATPDTRSWYIVGEGSAPVLKNSAWAGADVTDADKEACELKATGNATNEYSLTLDLFEGDKFQLIHDWQWEDQKGYGLMGGLDAELFESGGGLSGDSKTSNVGVLKSGNYTITLTTDPDEPAYDTVVIVRNGDPAGAPAEADAPYVPDENTRAVMKGSWVADWSENIDLTRDGSSNVFSITKEFAAGTEIYIMLWDGDKDTGVGFNSGSVKDDASKALLEDGANNIKFAADGTYTVTVDADSLTVTITK